MGLPEEARARRPDATKVPWGQVEELLAQIVEEVSVLAADHRRKEPRQIPRPYARTQQRPAAQRPHLQMMQAAMGQGRVQHV
jgi:hypothetical protein